MKADSLVCPRLIGASHLRVRLKLSPDRTLLGWASVWLFMAIVSVPLVEIRNLVPIGAVLLAAALLTDAVLALCEKPIGLEREVPEKGARGREAEITLQVHNPLSRPVTMQLRDSVPRDLVWPEPHWSRLDLEAGARRSLRYTIRPQVRGHRDWGRAVALVRSPLGLLRRVAGLSEQHEAAIVGGNAAGLLGL